VKVLITGSGGQVGRSLLDSVPAGAVAEGLSHKDLDITDESAVTSCLQRLRPDVIVNAAAYTAVDRAETEPDLAQRGNADGPRHLALAARGIGARLIHISTDFVFDGKSSVPYAPDAPTNPLSTYGRTKRAGEEAVLQALPDTSVVLRTAWVYAAKGSNFLLTMLRIMGAKGAVKVVADQIGTPTSARSVADAIWKIAQLPEVKGIHHWTDAGVASWYDFAVAIAEEAAQRGLLPPTVEVTPIVTAEYPTPARRPGYSVLDKRSLLAFGIAPVHWRRNLRAVLGEIANG
jgi:dTDP-4-dehydrorhamnose reductase